MRLMTLYLIRSSSKFAGIDAMCLLRVWIVSVESKLSPNWREGSGLFFFWSSSSLALITCTSVSAAREPSDSFS